MAVDPDPANWTDQQRAAFMATSLTDLLRVVPTAASAHANPSEVEGREAEARRIAALMDMVSPPVR